MEFQIFVPRIFSIDIEQFERYLTNNGWKHDVEYWDGKIRFTPVKYCNIQIILPTTEYSTFNISLMLRIAVDTLSQYMGEDIESVIESINEYKNGDVT